MTVEVERFGLFAYLWELTNLPFRLPVGMRDHTSWNTILKVAKLTDRDFPDDEEENE
jgi:hypothetical protein